MANVITSIPAQATEQYDLYVKPLLDDPKINSLPFDILVGKYKNRELYFNNNLDKATVQKITCGWDFQTGIAFTKKTIEPVEVACAIEQCYDELVNTIFANGLPDGFRRGELTPEVLNFLLTQQQYTFNRDLLSFLFLGDETISDAYYSIMDGIYAKLAAGVVAVDGTVDAGALTSSNLDTSNFFTTMKAVYDAQSRQLKRVAKNQKVWIWTESVYDAYLAYLYASTQTNAGAIQRESIVDGLETGAFMGIPIVVVGLVDERLEADFLDASDNVIDPYRVILTVGSNHKLLLDGSGFMAQEAWYSQDDDVYRIAGSALIAYEYGYGDLNVIAGF
jgi:hypothetical protein